LSLLCNIVVLGIGLNKFEFLFDMLLVAVEVFGLAYAYFSFLIKAAKDSMGQKVETCQRSLQSAVDRLLCRASYHSGTKQRCVVSISWLTIRWILIFLKYWPRVSPTTIDNKALIELRKQSKRLIQPSG